VKAPRRLQIQAGKNIIESVMDKAGSVSVILPAFNEEANIERAARACLKACEKHFDEIELIVVDDGSRDETAQIVRKLAEVEPRVKLLRHSRNRGYGATLRTGIRESKNDWIFFTDSDGQFDPEDISIMAPMLKDHDMVVGYRMDRRDNAYRRLMGWTFSRLTNAFFGTGVRDVDCAFKFMRADLVRSLELTSEKHLLNAEILYHARRMGWRVGEVGVRHFPRRAGAQTGGDLRVIAKSVFEYWRLYFRLKRNRSHQGISKT